MGPGSVYGDHLGRRLGIELGLRLGDEPKRILDEGGRFWTDHVEQKFWYDLGAAYMELVHVEQHRRLHSVSVEQVLGLKQLYESIV